LTFAQLLKRHRLAAGLTQAELAERARVSTRAVSDLERGVKRAPHAETVTLLADALALGERDRAAFVAAARGRPANVLTSPAPYGVPDSSTGSANGIPPLVGRFHELAQLERFLTGEGPPLLLFAGEPGIGKSRLLQEAGQQARAVGWQVLSGGCHRRSGQEPYTPVLTALEAFTARRSFAQVRVDLAGCGWLVRLLPELGDRTVAPTPTWTLPLEQERRLMFAAVGRFLANVAGPNGTLLVLDDLQWAGADAMDLLTSVLSATASPSDPPIRVVGAYRATDVHIQDPLAMLLADVAPAGLVTHQELLPLAPDEVTDLLDGLLAHLGIEESADVLTEQIVRRARGVPFYVVSCAQALQAEAIEAGGVSARPSVPWDVTQSVLRRVVALSEAAQHLLGVVAVAGQVVSRDVLLTTASPGTDEAALLAALDQACRARILAEVGASGYVFAHDLIREVVTLDLSAARRALLHRRIAEALERASGNLPVDRLAFHYAQADEHAKAAQYLEAAGDRAAAMHAHAAAAVFYRELAERSAGQCQLSATARAREKLGAVLKTVGRYDEALEVLEHAVHAYRATDDLEGLGRVLAHLGWAYGARRTPEEGLARLEPAVALYRASALEQDHGLAHGLAMLHAALADLYYVTGRYAEQLRSAERATELARATQDERLLSQAEQLRGRALFLLGQVGEGSRVFEEAIPLAESSGDLSNLCYSLVTASALKRAQGRFAEDRQLVSQAITASEQLGDPVLLAFVACNAAMHAFYSGEWVRARAEIARAQDAARAVAGSWVVPYVLFGSGQLDLAMGQTAEGIHQLAEAISLAERIGDVMALRLAHGALAESDLLAGRAEQAHARLAPLLGHLEQDETFAVLLLPLLAWAALERGRLAEADEIIAQTNTQAAVEQVRVALLDALRMRALADLRQTRWHEAETALDEAIALARAMPYPYAEAKTLYVYGQVHSAKGEPDQARERLEQALAICNQLGEGLYRPHIERVHARLPH
jgi:tetratricopeptide (TPR) repeat protein/transcriptional regulator with XRE-family HTH domain